MVLRALAVTGASGMLGWHLIRECIARGIACRAASRRRPRRLPPPSSWSVWDLQEWKTQEELDRFFPQVDALVHLGAMLPSTGINPADPQMFEINVRATLCLGLWALGRGIPMVFVSSSTVYADPDREGITEEDPKAERGMAGFYGYSKTLAEGILQYLAREGLQVCILRPSAIYGYGLPEDKMVTRFLKEAASGHPIAVSGPTDNRVNLIHAGEVARAILTALENKAFGVFNVAGPSNPTIQQIALACIKAVGRGEIQAESAAKSAIASTVPKIRFGLSCRAAQKAFGYSPVVDHEKGIQEMWSAIKEDQSEFAAATLELGRKP